MLLIGDSVSRGDTQAVRKALAGKANVQRAPANCGPTATGLKLIDVWLGDGTWDVIHFSRHEGARRRRGRLYAFITPHLAEVQPPNDVHFTGPGYDLLGRQVAEAILAALPAR